MLKIRKIRLALVLSVSLVISVLTACKRVVLESDITEATPESKPIEEEGAMRLYIDDTEVDVTWDENDTVAELQEQAAAGDIVVDMSMYGGWEQVGSLGRRYTRNDTRITAECGDIVLYSGNQIVVFYGSNTWEYTHLGKIDLAKREIIDCLSNNNVTLTLRAEK